MAAARPFWRLPYVHPSFFSPSFLQKKSFKTALRFVTLPFLVKGNRSFYVYNGQKFLQVIYKKEMAGFKLGSFALTKTIGYHPKKKKTKKRK